MSDYIRKTTERTVTGESEEPRRVSPSDGEYLKRVMKGTARNAVRVIGKERVYIDDPSEVPEGAAVDEGPQGGLYYETEQVEEFQQEMQNMKQKTFETYDWSDGEISAMESEVSRYEDSKEEDWARIMNAGRSVGATGGSYRIKGVGSALEKVHERGDNGYDEPGDLTDVFASRVFSNQAQDTRETADAIKEEFGEDAIVEEKNYMDGKEHAPYYRAVHLLVDFGDGKTGEIQVKSEDMADIAHVGHVAVYKNKLNLDDGQKDGIADCLTSMMDTLFDEADGPNCDDNSREIVQEVMEHGDEAEV